MANLKTINGIAAAREELFEKTLEGEIPEQRANVLERILRGQTEIKGNLPLKYLNLVNKLGKKGSDSGHPIGNTLKALDMFLGGEPEQIEGA